MKLTFPHIGNACYCVKALLNSLGIDCIVPPLNNPKALLTGSRHCPETACLPLKYNVGNLIQAREMGADTVLMVGGRGPCRFGYYCAMEEELLKEAGLGMDFITLELPDGRFDIFLKRLKKLAGYSLILKLPVLLSRVAALAKKLDELEQIARERRPKEYKSRQVDNLYDEFGDKCLRLKGKTAIEDTLSLIDNQIEKIKNVGIDKTRLNPAIGITGEIYTTIDSTANFHLEAKLGRMGFYVSRTLTISDWLNEHVISRFQPFTGRTDYLRASKPWLNRFIGGHGIENIAGAVNFTKKNVDGIIHIYCAGCMPEIAIRSSLNALCSEAGIPLLTLIMDELTGEAGFDTRLEAFGDIVMTKNKSKTPNYGS